MFSPVSALKIVLFFAITNEKQHKKQQNKNCKTIHLQKFIKLSVSGKSPQLQNNTIQKQY